MKKNLMSAAAAILLVAGLVLGGICAYQYFQLKRQCAEMLVRAEDKFRTATAATGTARAEELKKDAEDARKGAAFVCEDNKSRQTNYLLAGSSGAPVLIAASFLVLFFLRRTSRRLE